MVQASVMPYCTVSPFLKTGVQHSEEAAAPPGSRGLGAYILVSLASSLGCLHGDRPLPWGQVQGSIWGSIRSGVSSGIGIRVRAGSGVSLYFGLEFSLAVELGTSLDSSSSWGCGWA